MMRAEQTDGRRGIAIVIVVGLLSVLMLMAVAFSISMRIERKGAGSQRFSVQANHMMRAALIEAMSEIDRVMDSTTNFVVYPDWQVLDSYHGDGMKVPAEVLTTEGVDYIPFSLQAAVDDAGPRWGQFTVRSGNEDIIRGRYAYLAINTGGLLDANHVGGSNRLYGVNASEIQLAGLRDIRTAGTFLQNRNKHQRYETLPELVSLNKGLEAHYSAYPYPYDMVVYSRAEEGQFLVPNSWTGSNKVCLAGTVAQLQDPGRKAEIIRAFVRSGVEQGQADFVFQNFMDYLDTNSVPADLGTACTESVPMVSEFQAEYNAVGVPDAAAPEREQARVDLHVEMHFPFGRPAATAFNLNTEWTATLQNQVTKQKVTVTGACNRVDSGYNAWVDRKRYWPKLYAQPRITVEVPATNNVTVTLNVGVRAWVSIPDPKGGTNDIVVDSAPFPRSTYIALPTVTLHTGPQEHGKTGVECCDPRFNWGTIEASSWNDSGYAGNEFWRKSAAGGTLSTTNDYTVRYFQQERGEDQGTDMYVSDAGRLHTAGELGCLLAGGSSSYRFRTIRLFERDTDVPGPSVRRMHDVLKYFVITNGMRRGMVNLNTDNTNALAAVFYGAATDFGRTNAAVSKADAQRIARSLTGHTYWDVADVGNLHPPAGIGPAAGMNWTTAFPGLTDLQREAIISHSAGLLTVRQNLFTIILATDSYSMRIGGDKAQSGTVLASSHAVAEVWRDPFRDPVSKTHRFNVRLFRLLEY